MSEDVDKKLAAGLRARAPAERDPLFRVGVLQRREMDRYRTHSRLVLAAAVLVAVLAGTALVLRPDLALGIGLALGAAVIAAALYRYRDPIGQLVRRFVI